MIKTKRKPKLPTISYSASVPMSCPNERDVEKLISLFCLTAKKNKHFKKTGWLPLSREKILDLLGSRYPKTVRRAQDLGLIIAFKYEGEREWVKVEGLSKRFQLSPELEKERQAKKMRTIQITQKRFQTRPAATGMQPKKPTKKAACLKIVKQYEGSYFHDSWQDGPLGEEYPLQLYWVKQLDRKQITATQGKTGRLFSPLICCPSELRPLFRHQGRELVCFDAKSCCIQLLAKFEDGEGREKLLKIVEKGFYDHFAKRGITTEEVKVATQQALSPASYRKSDLAYKVEEYVFKNFDGAFRWLATDKGHSNQHALQSLEASIFVNVFESASYAFYPLHDGFACLPEDAERAMADVQARANEILGFNLIMNEKK